MALHLNGAAPRGMVDSGAGMAYRFVRNGTVVDVVWGGGRTSLPTASGQVQAFDLGGGALPVEVSDGQIHVTVGGDPVFIEHTGTPIAAPPSPPSGQSYALPAQSPGLPPGFAGRR